MRQDSHNRSFISTLVVFCLLLSIVCSSVTTGYTTARSHAATILKKPGNTAKSDTQLPEKIESENDYKPHINFVFIHAVGAIVHFDFVKSLQRYTITDTRFRAITTGLPLYLVMRVIMI